MPLFPLKRMEQAAEIVSGGSVLVYPVSANRQHCKAAVADWFNWISGIITGYFVGRMQFSCGL